MGLSVGLVAPAVDGKNPNQQAYSDRWRDFEPTLAFYQIQPAVVLMGEGWLLQRLRLGVRWKSDEWGHAPSVAIGPAGDLPPMADAARRPSGE
jgi:hypothetical protein